MKHIICKVLYNLHVCMHSAYALRIEYVCISSAVAVVYCMCEATTLLEHALCHWAHCSVHCLLGLHAAVPSLCLVLI